jgi:hypothetical protein
MYALHPKLGRGIEYKEALTAVHPEDYAAPKLLACAERVAASPGCGHIIFCEPTAVHQWLREVLVSKKGIPRERIAIVNGATASPPNATPSPTASTASRPTRRRPAPAGRARPSACRRPST